MSLLLGQRKSLESGSPKSDADSPSTTTQVGGIPLLMRLPDLRPAKSLPSASQAETGKTSETDAAGQQPPESLETSSAAEQSKDVDGEDGRPRSAETSGGQTFGWRSSLWHLLIPIGLLVLFLAVWAVVSSPGEQPSESSAETEIEAPDIDTGELVSPENLAMPEFEPIDNPEESTDPQLSEAAPATAPGTDTTGDSVDASIPDSAREMDVDVPSDISSAPPLLETSDDPRTTTADGFVGQPYNMASKRAAPAQTPSMPAQAPPAPKQAPPAPPQTSKGFNYPTTDPSAYGYSPEANTMPGGQPATNPYSYPTTGAPSLHAPSGAAPGVPPR